MIVTGIVSGRENKPENLPSPRAAITAVGTTPAQPAIPAPSQEEVNERLREQRKWTEKDEQELGMIQLRLSHTLYSSCGLTSYCTWRNLEDQFGKPGAVRGHLQAPMSLMEYAHLTTPDKLHLADTPYIPPHH